MLLKTSRARRSVWSAGGAAPGPPGYLGTDESNEVLTPLTYRGRTEQGGTPLAVTGEDSLPRWFGAGRLALGFICSQISSGGPGGEAPPGVTHKEPLR